MLYKRHVPRCPEAKSSKQIGALLFSLVSYASGIEPSSLYADSNIPAVVLEAGKRGCTPADAARVLAANPGEEFPAGYSVDHHVDNHLEV